MPKSSIHVFAVVEELDKEYPVYPLQSTAMFDVFHHQLAAADVLPVLSQQFLSPLAALVLDFHTPLQTSIGILEQLRMIIPQASPIIFVVGDNDAEVAVAAMRAGAIDYGVRKRTSPQKLLDILHSGIDATKDATNLNHRNLTDGKDARLDKADELAPMEQMSSEPIGEESHDSTISTALQTISQLQQSKKQLQRSQKFIAEIAEAVPGMLYVFDLVEQCNTYINKQMGSWLGYTNEQVQAMGGKVLPLLMHPEDFARVPAHLAQFQSAPDGEILEFEYRMRHADNTWRWLHTCEVVFQRDENQTPQQILGITQDVTARKNTEALAHESDARFRLLAETIQDVFWIMDLPDPKIVYVSPAYEEVWGRSPEFIYQNHTAWLDTVHPDDRDNVLAGLSNTPQKDVAIEKEYRIVRPDGEVRWIRDRGFAVTDEQGHVFRMLGVAQDVTKRKQAEAALAENEARLRGFVESNVIGILYGDIYGNIFHANDELLRIVGYSRQELKAGQLHWIEMTPPEYLPLDEQKISEAQAEGACIPYEKEYIRKDGRRVPVLIGYSLLGEHREESVVFILDLSTRKRAERALRRSEDRLKMATESAQIGTWDWNLEKNVLSWNGRCKEMFGLSPDAKITIETFFEALHPDEQDRVRHIVGESLIAASGGQYDIEYRVIGIEDGVERWILAKGQAYFAQNGVPRRFVGTVMDVTDRKRAEATLRENQERLQMAIEGAEAGLWDWHIDTHEHYSSSEWLRMLEYGPNELPAKYSSWENLIHPDDKPMVMEKLYSHLQDSSIPYRFDYRLLTKSGKWKWIANFGKVVVRDDEGKPVRMSGIHQDISDRKRAEQQLRLSEDRYRTLANAVSQLMWVNAADGKVEFFNQQWKNYTGVKNLELDIRLWTDIVHPDDFEKVQAIRIEAMRNKSPYEVEVRFKRHDQVYRWHLSRTVPLINEAGELVNWFGTATDIDDRKAAEAEREQLLKQEQAARAAAERANRIKDEFLAILSHELRSPLNPILGWTQLLKIGGLNAEKTATALETIERNVKLQTQLVDDLLDVARILRGKLKLHNAPVDLAKTVAAAIETVNTAATAKTITLNTDLEMSAQAWGDAARIQQIVWNLLSNAIKFTPIGGEVTVRLQQTPGNEGRIIVADTGKGIHPNFLPHIFESFRQEDVSITRQHGGLGLGLAIVRHLVEAHGGEIAADSAGEGQGATFTVTLPLMSRRSNMVDDSTSALENLELNEVRVLTVDDNADSREVLSTLLEQYGAQVVAVKSGREALACLASFKPDVLISDLSMPDMDGYVLLRQIRALSSQQNKPVPAIALTACARQEDENSARANGFQKHIAKPVNVDTLIQAVSEIVKSNRQQ
ncbi:PAS domain-containing protein [Oscillatoria sp. CS-180]|uniref:PAS domain-containing protein n=1 Tax=Oscillatoria sp. CS-180 TaxID=3021720 RepID=UPI0023308376|nr:PAS domain-containing protein [Oscillatoria sp. CS-180]MDB9524880.1 PAS domain-containing protein [Oscillatoria sp. CS-180]